MGWASFRDKVKGVAAPIAGTVSFGLPALMISSGSAAIGGLAGMLGGGALPQPGSGGGGMQYGQQQDFGPQQNLSGLMNMIGQQQPTVSMTGGTLGGGGLI